MVPGPPARVETAHSMIILKAGAEAEAEAEAGVFVLCYLRRRAKMW